MAIFWEIAAHSFFVILVISRFGFKGWILVLIASVPDLCILLPISRDHHRV